MAAQARPPDWTISIVSHGHGAGVARLLDDCARLLDPAHVEIAVTLNLAGETLPAHGWTGPLVLVRNTVPAGFAANHDAALRAARGLRFAALDPDLVLQGDPLPALAEVIDAPELRLAAPRVVDAAGRVQDNARRAVTPLALLRRHLLRRADAVDARAPTRVDWIAGLFIAARREALLALGGFDVRYRMYCEDAELGLRCWNRGGTVWVVPAGGVVHDARRRTLRSPRHFAWHAASLARLWTSATFWRFLRHRPRADA